MKKIISSKKNVIIAENIAKKIAIYKKPYLSENEQQIQIELNRIDQMIEIINTSLARIGERTKPMAERIKQIEEMLSKQNEEDYAVDIPDGPSMIS